MQAYNPPFETLSLKNPWALLIEKISFCVFFILFACTENTRKVFKLLWRMRGKYLSVFGEYAESIQAYMEKMASWGYLRYTKSSPNTRKVFKCIRRIRGKNLSVHGVDAKRLLTYSPNSPKDIKVCYWLIIIRILNFFIFFLCRWFRFAQLAKGKKSRPQ